MDHRDLRITSAVLESPVSGTIELSADWIARNLPRLSLAERPHRFDELRQLPDHAFGLSAGYYVDRKGALHFIFDPAGSPGLNWRETPLFVAGSFNGWQDAIGRATWRLREGVLDDRVVLEWTGPADAVL